MGKMDANYNERMAQAIAEAKRNIDEIGWFYATEYAAEDYDVSLPELQRAIAA